MIVFKAHSLFPLQAESAIEQAESNFLDLLSEHSRDFFKSSNLKSPRHLD